MKLLTVMVPCYNSAEYMGKCINCLLVGGDRIEILIVDDGSAKDNTAEIADFYERKYPGIIRTIHQENKGHGGAVNTGIENARGLYFKVCDSDDHLNKKALLKVLDVLEHLTEDGQEIDMMLTNYVYDKQDAKKKMVMRYRPFFPKNTIFGWKDTRKVDIMHYVLMHSIIYRTEILRKCGIQLPEHTFYVDNLYAYEPIPYVKKLYYLDVDLYRYFIGREDQSVNETVMIGRLDQQLLVNNRMIDYLAEHGDLKGRAKDFMVHSLSIIMTVTTIMCYLSKDESRLYDKVLLWEKLRNKCPVEYLLIRNNLTGIFMNIPGPVGRKMSIVAYHLSQKLFGFN